MNFNKERLIRLKPYLIIGVLVVSMAVGVYFVRMQQLLRSKATQDNVGIVFIPDTKSGIKVGENFSTAVFVSAGAENRISAIDFTLVFPENIDYAGFQHSSANGLDTPIISDYNPINRTFRFVAVNKQGTIPYSTAVNIGTLQLKGAKNGAASLNFSNVQITAASKDTALTVDASKPGSFTVGEGPTPTPAPLACVNGDANNDGCVDEKDFQEWFAERTGVSRKKAADFYPTCTGRFFPEATRGDGIIDNQDFNIWFQNRGEGCKE